MAGRSSWSDGPRAALEMKLASVLVEIEERAEADDLRDQARRRKEEERARLQRASEDRARLARTDAAHAERLVAEARAHRRAKEVRAYLAALEARLAAVASPERARLAPWLEWARNWAESSDPVRRTALISGLEDEDRGALPRAG